MNIAVVSPDYTNKALASPNVDGSIADVLLDKVALRGADGDTLKTLSDQLDAITSSLSAMGSNKKITITAAENIAEGEVVLSSSGGFIPESSLTNMVLTLIGTETGNNVGANNHTLYCIEWINSSTLIVVYADVANSYYSTAVPVRVNNDRTLTKGNIYVFSSSAVAYHSIASIGNNEFVITYRASGSFTPCKAIAGRWTENNQLAFGAVASPSGADNTTEGPVCKAATGKFCMAYDHPDNPHATYFIAGTVNSSLAISLGAPVAFGSDSCTLLDICQIDTDKVMATYRNTGVGNDFYTTIATLDGTTIAKGNDTVITTDDDLHSIVRALSPSLAVILFRHSTTNSARAIACSIDDTTPTFGNIVKLSTGTNGTFPSGLVKLSSTEFAAFWDNATSNITEYITGKVSGTTIAAGRLMKTATDWGVGNMTWARLCAVNDSNDIAYIGNSASNLYAVLYDPLWKDDNYTIYDISGVADAAIDAAATGDVIVDGVKKGAASGLDTSKSYFIDQRAGGVRKKEHSCTIDGYIRRVRVLDTDATLSIG